MSSIPARWRERSTHDGRVTLRLPAGWGQAFEEETGTTYFGAEDDTQGLLRITPLVFSKNAEILLDELPTLFSGRPEHANVQQLSDTRYMVEYIEEAEEAGEPLILQYWETLQLVAPRRVTLVVAGYTLGREETLATAAPLLAALRASFRDAAIREPAER